MKKYVYEESNGLWYERRGDYDFPCLTPEEPAERPIGVWGRRHAQYLKQQRKAIWFELFSTGRLGEYLSQIDEQADAMLDQLMTQMAEREDVTEALKAQDQILWVQRMNSIRSRAEEIVNQELIYP